jgi:D-alanyl-D-alanine carboxypeptidase (penicillin-binding protein 5/6)
VLIYLRRIKLFLLVNVILALTLNIFIPVTSFGASPASPLETTAESAVLMEPFSGQVLLAKEKDKELPMASVTKLMSLLVALKAIEEGRLKLNDIVIASENAWEMGGSQIYLEPGEEFTLEEILIAVAVGSANDASVALAEQIAGSEEAFVQIMNQKAKELGLKHTHFVNCTGLPAKEHYTSAYDLALILRECLKYPLFIKYSSIYEYDLRGGQFKLWNTNKLLKWYPGTDAGKTGWTEEAKYCLASTVTKDGLRLIAVVLGTPEPRSHFRESIKLYQYGFARYKAIYLAQQGEKVKRLPISKGNQDYMEIITKEPVCLVVLKGEENKNFKTHLDLPTWIVAPVKKGQVIGTYIVMDKEGKKVLRVPLIAQNQVEKASVLRQVNKTLSRLYNFN